MAIFGFDASKFSNVGKTLQKEVSKSISSVTGQFDSMINSLSSKGMSIDGIKDVMSTNVKGALLKDAPRVSPQQLLTKRSFSGGNNSPEKRIGRSRNTLSSAADKFPPDLDSEVFMQIEFAKYNRPSPTSETEFNTNYILHLPVPLQLTETHSLKYSESETGAFGAAAGALDRTVAALQATNVKDEDVKKSAQESTNDALGFAYYQLNKFLSMGGEALPGLVGQQLGVIPNPHIAVFFQGVNLRGQMDFSWLLAARNRKESETISKIIKTIRSKILPRVSTGSGNLMEYPHMVRLYLYPWASSGGDNMPTYKRGFFTDLEVNWVPAADESGLSIFNDTAAPTMVSINLKFMEMEIFTADDYGSEKFNATDKIKNSDLGQKLFSKESA